MSAPLLLQGTPEWLQVSFEAITRYEIAGRSVMALGTAAAEACRRAGVQCAVAPHPSSRGLSFEERARAIAEVLPIV